MHHLCFSSLKACLILIFCPLASGNTDFVPIEVLLGVPEYAQASISPDGRYLTGGRVVGVLKNGHQIYETRPFVLDIENPQRIRNIYDFPQLRRTNIIWVGWTAGSRLLIQTNRGIYSCDPDGGNFTELSGYSHNNSDRVNPALGEAYFLSNDRDQPDYIYLAQRNPGDLVLGLHRRYIKHKGTFGGVFHINTRTGEYRQVAEIPFLFALIICDFHGHPRFVIGNPDVPIERSGRLKDDFHIKEGSVPWLLHREVRPILADGKIGESLPFAARSADRLEFNFPISQPVASAEGFPIFFLSNQGSDKMRLVRLDSPASEPVVLFEHFRVDLRGLVIDPFGDQIVGVDFLDGSWSTHWFSKELAKVAKTVDRLLPHRRNVLVSWDRAHRRFVISSRSSSDPGEHFLLDLEAKSLDEISVYFPAAQPYRFSSVEHHIIPARDGVALDVYVTLPWRLQKLGQQPPYPTVFLIHGGPHSQDTPDFNSAVQFFADRGYAVVQVNFRGSTGYGTSFINMARQQWGLTMQDDLTDTVNWALSSGIAQEGQLCLVGNSYGAYAALLELTRTPERYAAGILGAGVYDLVKHLEDREKYLGEETLTFYIRWLGDPGDPGDRQRLLANSPLYRVSSIQAPVFLWHGDRDPVAPVDQTYAVAKSLRKHRKIFDTHYELWEGHGFRYAENRIILFQQIEKFLLKHFPGRLLGSD